MRHFLHLIVAVVMGCGLLMTTACTSGRSQQLTAAVERINESCPSGTGDGVVFEEITLADGKVLMLFSIQESAITNAVTAETVKEWKPLFVNLFAAMVHENADVAQLFRLIGDTHSTLSVVIALKPSMQQFTIALDETDIQSILDVDNVGKAKQ